MYRPYASGETTKLTQRMLSRQAFARCHMFILPEAIRNQTQASGENIQL